MNYYPVFLNLQNKKIVVIGGGKVAERKVISLLRAGGEVTVVSPTITARLEREKSRGSISHLRRRFLEKDLAGAFLVISATDSPEINSKAAKNAPALVNVVDVPSLCNFIVPSAVKRGPLVVAVSTSGVSPAMARTLRMELKGIYGPEFSDYLRFLKGM